MNPYTGTNIAESYLAFLDSNKGKIQQQILLEAILKHLGKNTSQRILDAACGSGWLTAVLAKEYPNIFACDESVWLIEHARIKYPTLEFKITSLFSPLPYPDNSFDTILLNMSISDLSDINSAYKTLKQILTKHGKLIVTLPNPYYAYPRAVWKRGLLGKLLGKKPAIRFYQHYFNNLPDRHASWNENPSSYVRPLGEYINSALNLGFTLVHYGEIKSPEDSKDFNLQYQSHRFPVLLLLVFKKSG